MNNRDIHLLVATPAFKVVCKFQVLSMSFKTDFLKICHYLLKNLVDPVLVNLYLQHIISLVKNLIKKDFRTGPVKFRTENIYSDNLDKCASWFLQLSLGFI